MKILLWVLAGIVAIALLGGVVLPVVGWLLHALGWVIAPLVVVGGGIWVAKKIGDGRDRVKHDDAAVTHQDGTPLV